MSKGAKGTGTIRQRKDGKWEGQFYFKGSRKSIYGDDYDSVRARLNKITAEIIEKQYVAPSNTPFGEWLDKWLELYAKPGIRESTYISYETYIRAHIKPAIGDVKLKNVDNELLQKFFNEEAQSGRKDNKKGGLSAKTLKNMYNMLHACLKQAVHNDIIPNNPCSYVKLPRIQPKEMRVLSFDEERKLIDAVLGSNKAIPHGIIIALFTGVRIGELVGLQWQDVNLASKFIMIRRRLRRQKKLPDSKETIIDIRCDGSNSTNSTALFIGNVKTLKGNRKIYLPETAVKSFKFLQLYLCENRKISGESFNSDNFVLFNEFGFPYDPRTYADIFKSYVKKAGLKAANFHALRHTFATRALEMGMDINTLAEILGHAQPSTTLNKYGHCLDDHKKSEMEKFNGLF